MSNLSSKQPCVHPWCWIVFSEDGNPACSACNTNLLGPSLPPVGHKHGCAVSSYLRGVARVNCDCGGAAHEPPAAPNPFEDRARAWDGVARKLEEINPHTFEAQKTGLQCALDQIERMRAPSPPTDPVELQNRLATLNRCVDNIRELCEDNRGNVPFLGVVLDEIAMVGPMYERTSVTKEAPHDEHCDVNDPIIKGKPCNCRNRVPVETGDGR